MERNLRRPANFYPTTETISKSDRLLPHLHDSCFHQSEVDTNLEIPVENQYLEVKRWAAPCRDSLFLNVPGLEECFIRYRTGRDDICSRSRQVGKFRNFSGRSAGDTGGCASS